MFMHFSCVRHGDKSIQKICSNLLEKHQTLIEKFLRNVLKLNRFPRSSIQYAIEDVESADELNTSTGSVTSFLKSETQQTPRTAKFINDRHVENMHLKVQLETEKYERGYLEMQAKHNEEKIMKLDVEHKKSVAVINELNKQLAHLKDELEASEKNGVDRVIKQLRKQINDKEEKVADCIMDMNALKDNNAFLEEKLKYAERQIQILTHDKMSLNDDIERIRSELDDRDKTISYINSRNRELEEMIKELRADNSTERRMYESSFDFLNASASSAVESSEFAKNRGSDLSIFNH